MKHTPGPWTLVEEGDRYDELKVIGPEEKGSFYPKTIANAGMVYGDEDVANFALIAAAPELLTALIVALDALRPSASNARRNEVRAVTRAVIAKAIAKATRGQP